MITGMNFIGNRQVAGGNIRYKTFDPMRNTENEWWMTEATADELNEAVELSWDAFRIYRKVPGGNRALFLEAIAAEIEALGDDLLKIYCMESGLPESRARVERTRTLFQLRSFAAMLRKDWPETTVEAGDPERPSGPKPDLRKTYIPLGPVAVFGSSNFPLAYSTAGGDTASALAAGCPVVVKSHPMHAGTGELVAGAVIRAAQHTNMPDGVFSNLNSRGIELGQQLVLHPRIRAVGFTGSIRGGRALFDLAATRAEPIPVFAEMGSINPVVMTPGALRNKAEHWANVYAESITQGTGQFCTNPGLLLVPEIREIDGFVQVLSGLLDGMRPGCMLHPDIHAAFNRLREDVSQQQAVQMLTADGKTTGCQVNPGLAMVDGASFLDNPALHQEVFGPFSLIVRYRDPAQLLQIIETLEGQLTGTLLAEAEELSQLHAVVDALQQRVGRIIFNGVPTGVEVCAAMQHGGPYPASTDSRFTAVGIQSIRRWIRPVAFQNFPPELLPVELRP